MNVTIALIVLFCVLFILNIALAVSDSKDGDRKSMWLHGLTAVANLAAAIIYVCIYLKIPPPF